MSECHHYGCPEPGTERLKAWGPGVVRTFCEPHADLRRDLSGYTEDV